MWLAFFIIKKLHFVLPQLCLTLKFVGPCETCDKKARTEETCTITLLAHLPRLDTSSFNPNPKHSASLKFAYYPTLCYLSSHSQPQHQPTVTEAEDDLQSLHQQGILARWPAFSWWSDVISQEYCVRLHMCLQEIQVTGWSKGLNFILLARQWGVTYIWSHIAHAQN